MTLEETKKYFEGDVFASQSAGIHIEAIDHQFARCVMPITKAHCNANGGVMGGAIYTLADFAFAVAVNHEERMAVSLVGEITYLSAAKGKCLTAEASCVKAGRSTCCYQIRIFDELKTEIALVNMTGFYVEKKPKIS